MALFDSLATKTLDALPRARANAEAARQRLRAHDASKPSGEDAEVSYLWNRDRTEMALRLEAADEAVKFQEEKATAAEKELAQRAAAAETRAVEKAAIADEKLIRDAEALSIKLAAKLAEIEVSRRRTSDYNARRGDRPHVSDAEERVRQTPAKQVPAEYRDEEAWIDGAGNQPTHYRVVKGDLVPSDHGDYRKVNRKTETMCAHWLPAQMPTRLADAIKLVDLQGKPLWPAQ